MTTKPKLHKCPACRQIKGAKLIYGMPIPELWPFIEEGLLIAHGCEPPLAGEPHYKYQCTGCWHKFGGDKDWVGNTKRGIKP